METSSTDSNNSDLQSSQDGAQTKDSTPVRVRTLEKYMKAAHLL